MSVRHTEIEVRMNHISEMVQQMSDDAVAIIRKLESENAALRERVMEMELQPVTTIPPDGAVVNLVIKAYNMAADAYPVQDAAMLPCKDYKNGSLPLDIIVGWLPEAK